MIVIIGLGTGGIYAARWASKINRKEKIMIIEKRSYETYSPCSIPLVVEGAIEIKEIIHPFPKTPKIEVLLEHEAIDIKPEKKIVLYRKIGSKEVKEVKYDKLIYGGGAFPVIPPVPGVDKKGVFTVRSVEDAQNILAWIKHAKRAVVIGAGAIGVEMAYALRKRGLEVSVVEMLSHPFPKNLDDDMAILVTEYMQNLGIKCRYNSKVDEIIGHEKVEGVRIGEEIIPADMVILSAGVRPNTQILKGKVELDEHGFVLVNERMETSQPDMYAVGDCAKTPYGIIQLATVAARHGIVAGINAAGGNAKYTPHTGAFVSAMGNFEVACVGTRATVSGRGHSTITPHSKKQISVKIFTKEDGTIAGAQAVGFWASKKIDIISALMRGKGKIWDVAFMEHAYCPVVAHLYDVINIAANNAMRRLKIEEYPV